MGLYEVSVLLTVDVSMHQVWRSSWSTCVGNKKIQNISQLNLWKVLMTGKATRIP